MKKIIKNPIFTFILGALIFGGIAGVSAYTLFANDIRYTPKDSTWKKSNGENITNVGDAIDELYTKANEETGTISFNNMTSTLVYRKSSYSGKNTVITISNVSDYKYYFVTDVYNGGACTTESGCNNTLALTFDNANYVDLGLSYRLDSIRSASRSFFLMPITNEDIQITVSGGIDGIAVYGIN